MQNYPMNAESNLRGSLRVGAMMILAIVLAGILPTAAIAGPTAPQQQTKKQSRKVYYVFTTGSKIPVPVDRINGHIATTATHEQVIRITNRNRLQPVEFWYADHAF